MLTRQNGQEPERVIKPSANASPNEIIVVTVPRARNDDMPHSLDVAGGVVAPAESFGDNSIDGVLLRIGVGVRSIERIFVPRNDVQSDTPATILAPSETQTAQSESDTLVPISADYQKDEDNQNLSRSYKIVFDGDVNLDRVCNELRKSKAIQQIMPNFLSEPRIIPDDELYGQQWGPEVLNCEEAWDIETGHPDLVIAIVDTGVDLKHQDLQSKIIPGQDFVNYTSGESARYRPVGDYMDRDFDPEDENGHGTHCAGIAAAASHNGTGITGVCWNGKILPVRVMFKVFDKSYGIYQAVGLSTDIAAGIKYAVDAGAHVINLSLGNYSGSSTYSSVLQYAYDQGVCLIAATGNDNTSNASYPAANTQTLAVGAVDSSLNRASFSNYGSAYGKFVVAPGVHISSTYIGNDYVYLDGTSMAAPFVTGIAGLAISLGLRNGKKLAVEEVYKAIRDTATPLGTGKGDRYYGEGLVNAEAVLKAVQEKLQF